MPRKIYEFGVGERVVHCPNGKGIVKRLFGHGKMLVLFDKGFADYVFDFDCIKG